MENDSIYTMILATMRYHMRRQYEQAKLKKTNKRSKKARV